MSTSRLQAPQSDAPPQKRRRMGFLLNSDDESSESVQTASTEATWTSDKEYHVEQVLAERTENDGSNNLLIQWSGYPMSASTWEPKDGLARVILDGWYLKQQQIEKGYSEMFNWKRWERQERQKKNHKHTKRAVKRWMQGLPLGSVQYMMLEKPELFENSERRSKQEGDASNMKKETARSKPASSPSKPNGSAFSSAEDSESDVPLAKARTTGQPDHGKGAPVSQESTTAASRPFAKKAATAVSSPLLPDKKKSGTSALTIIKDPMDTGKSAKRKGAHLTTSTAMFMNLSHHNNYLKKQKHDAIPDASLLNLVAPGTRGAPPNKMPNTNTLLADIAKTSNQRSNIDRDAELCERVLSQDAELVCRTSPVESQAVHLYQQHDKPPGFIPLTCPYWLNRRDCPRTTGCFFKHAAMDSHASFVLFIQAENESTQKGQFALKFGFFGPTQVCSFWAAKKHCKNSNDVCWYTHWQPVPSVTALVQVKVNKTCPFWAKGKCNKSDAQCKFLHQVTDIIASRPGDGLEYGQSTSTFGGSIFGQAHVGHADTSGETGNIPLSPVDQAPTAMQTRFGPPFVHPYRGAVAWAAENGRAMRCADTKPQHQIAAESLILTRIKLRLLEHDIEATWKLPPSVEQIFRQAGGLCYMNCGVSVTDLHEPICSDEVIASGRFSNIEGNSSSLSRMQDLALWMQVYAKAAWHPLHNSSLGILVLPFQHTEWSSQLPGITKDSGSTHTTGLSFHFYILKQDRIMDGRQSIPESLANMDAMIEQIHASNKLKDGTQGPESFFGWFDGRSLHRNVYIGEKSTTAFSRLTRLYFERAGAAVFQDWEQFKLSASEKAKEAGIIILDWNKPLEIIKTLPGFSHCLANKSKVFQFGVAQSDGILRCRSLCTSGSVYHLSTDALIENADVSVKILNQYVKKRVLGSRSRSWKLYLQNSHLALMSTVFQRLQVVAQRKPEENVVHTITKLVGALAPIDNASKENLKDPLILLPDTNIAGASDEITLADFVKWTITDGLFKSRRFKVILSQDQFDNFKKVREANQHISFYTAQGFSSSLSRYL